MRDVQAGIDRLAQFQIDSINVVTRAHFMPLFSRLGPYDPELCWTGRRSAPPRRLFEYWGHAASLIDVRPPAGAALADGGRRRGRLGPGASRSQAEQPRLVDDVRAEVAERGPLSARQIEHEEERRHDHWGWNWSSVKTVLEWLFWPGEITAAGRNRQFERLYDLTERVIPPAVLARPTPTRDEADVVLVRRAAQALGVGSDRAAWPTTSGSPPAGPRQAIAVLVETGELLPVAVARLGRAGRLPVARGAAAAPDRARALLSPFDSLVFERRRLEQLFGFHYRIEIYVPEAKRVHGYYVYPFLLDSELVARVDLKADRARRGAAGQLGLAGARRRSGRRPARRWSPSWSRWPAGSACRTSRSCRTAISGRDSRWPAAGRPTMGVASGAPSW